MVEEDRWCPDILIQISAIQAAIDQVALRLAEDHARNCVIGGPRAKAEDRATELMAAMKRLVRRR
jgi:CsoR family transcriptional regulator, copper-sensing transcriptional repressor